jgi:hypothetical protein
LGIIKGDRLVLLRCMCWVRRVPWVTKFVEFIKFIGSRGLLS